MATNIVGFFEGLAQRKYHENDLSDVIYALCLGNPQFKKFFLDFFFADQELSVETSSIEREVSYPDGSRPDFVIRADGKIYFVEVKIWDRSHHFSQYAETLRKLGSNQEEDLRLGYIANYIIDDLSPKDKEIYRQIEKAGRVKQWSEFIKNLKAKEWSNSEEVQGVIAYCESVCPDNSDEEISLYLHAPTYFRQVKEFYSSLQTFLQNSPKIKVSNHVIQLDKYRVANTPSEIMGFYFGAVDVAPGRGTLFAGEKVWGWVGLRLKNTNPEKNYPGLCIAFDNIQGWGKPVFKHLKETTAWLPFCFDLPAPDKDLGKVFEDVFCSVFSELISGNCKQKDGERRGIDSESPYYAVRRLPLFLRQNVFPKLEIAGCSVSTFYQKDTFNPLSWCGEYFSVTKLAQEGVSEKEVGRFWVGTYYDDREHANQIVCEQIGGETRPFRLEQNCEVKSSKLCKFICDFVHECIGKAK